VLVKLHKQIFHRALHIINRLVQLQFPVPTSRRSDEEAGSHKIKGVLFHNIRILILIIFFGTLVQKMETKEKCKTCNKTTGCDIWLSCEICDGWFHASCVKVNDAAYKVLKELETCHWFCQSCNLKMGKVIPSIVKMSDRVNEIDGRVEKLEKEQKVQYGRYTKLEAKQEAYDQELKAVQVKFDAIFKEMDKTNANFGELNVSLQKTVENQKINFRDITKDQMEQERMNVSETVKKEVSDSLGKVNANIQQVQSDI